MNALLNTLVFTLGTVLARPAEAPPAPGLVRFTGIRLLTDNAEALQAKRDLIAQARTSLDLVYFILEHDDTSKLLLADLVEAGRRGVKVRLLVDHLMTFRDTAQLQALAAHPNLEIRQYGPPPQALLDALDGLGIDTTRFIAGLAGADPEMLIASLPKGLFPAKWLETLREPVQASLQAPLVYALQVLARLSELVKLPDVRDWHDMVLRPGKWFSDSLAAASDSIAALLPRLPAIITGLNAFLHRTHHKLLLADRRKFIMGGRNLADAYQTARPAKGRPFLDTDIQALDSRPESLEHIAGFEALWALGADVRTASVATLPPARQKDALPPDAPDTQPFPKPTVVLADMDGFVVNGLSGPQEAAITFTYTRLIDELVAQGAGGVVDIVSAYAFLDDELCSAPLIGLRRALMHAAQSGITVNLRTNAPASTDLGLVNVAFYQNVVELIDAGVHVFELKPGHGSLHTKAAAIGKHVLVIGSYNMDPRSELYDSNNLIVLHDPEGTATQAFRDVWVTPDYWVALLRAEAEALQRQTFKQSLFLLPIEPLL